MVRSAGSRHPKLKQVTLVFDKSFLAVVSGAFFRTSDRADISGDSLRKATTP